ncbi:Zinc finger protein [Abeliophyllum distichum]|uniref:Zinc finger protein n=1 Tax=Abeliophyllum distichum TaxID=126358 RepID=A0ABD1V8C8_9LAMI
MLGKNKGVCHSCRPSGHYLPTCPKKKRCHVYGEGFVKWMEVEKKSANIGSLFFCCSSNCGYFKWSDDVGEASGDYEVARISEEEEDVEISVNVTIRKGKGTAEENNKGKDKTK